MMLFDDTVLQKDCIFKGTINIKSKTGELKGWMKKDLLLPNRINVYDRYGNMSGFFGERYPESGHLVFQEGSVMDKRQWTLSDCALKSWSLLRMYLTIEYFSVTIF